MSDKLTDEQNEAILKALNDTIDKGPWDKSSFLKMIGKNLILIRDKYIDMLGEKSPSQLKAESHLAQRNLMRSEQKEVFVSLYSADGSSMQSWEKIVANLPRQMISRPIYDSEEHIKEILKTKENKMNEAYVAIYINKVDILALSAEKSAFDKLGKALISLKDKTLNLDNITRFVHVTGVYRYERGRLIKTLISNETK